jgi:hypothetical protein
MGRGRKSTSKQNPTNPAVTEIPEEEQWRLINDSGILKKVTETSPPDSVEESWPLAEEIFNAVIFIIPMSFLLMLMEM